MVLRTERLERAEHDLQRGAFGIVVGIVVLMLLACLAVIVFFRRTRLDTRPWHTLIAPALGLVGLHGSSTDVGVVGYTLGGGLPLLGRTYGFAADHVRSFEIVTPDGVLRHVDAGYERAVEVAAERGVRIPMGEG